MPYVICAPCELRTYSAALWAATEVCPRCGTDLPRARRPAVPLSQHPRFRGRAEQDRRLPLGRQPETRT